MVLKNTLKIKHLPKELSESQKEEFIRHFGAIHVKVITSRIKAKSVVYAKFETEEIAKNVMLRLHQINILNSRLSIEYAENDLLQGPPPQKKISDRPDLQPDQKFFTTFIEKVNAFNDSVGFHQPPPPHFKYDYPKANRGTINNIAHALATVPRFYIQVLHLMNKMNLPPPFARPIPPSTQVPPATQRQPVIQSSAASLNQSRVQPAAQKVQTEENSDESELESDEEPNKIKEIIPAKRQLSQKKVIKRPKFIKQTIIQTTTSTKVPEKRENVFEKSDLLVSKKIELKVNTAPLSENREIQENLPPFTKPELQTTTLAEIPQLTKKEESQEKQLGTEGFGLLLINKLEEVLAHTAELKKLKTSPLLTFSLEKEQQEHAIRTEQSNNDTVKELAENIENESKTEKEITNNKSNEQSNNLKIEDKVDNVKDEEKQAEDTNIEMEQEGSQTQLEQNPASPDVDENPCISLEELAANQITDFTIVPVFKNYKPGTPTNKLYIKNCAKTVVEQDLEYIFNRYKEPITEDKVDEFNIRLMQEGRMKGQAFITLNSIEMAQKAVKETNGFILKDKPLVVVFGKAGTKKK